MGERTNFTAGRVAAFACPEGKSQDFLWDAKAAGLGLRVTRGGGRSFVFQSRFSGESLRMTIGTPSASDAAASAGAWTIPDARAEARRLQALIDQGRDPRVEKAETSARDVAVREAQKTARARLEVVALEAWDVYCEDRRRKPTDSPKVRRWSERSYQDHRAMTAAGGEPRKRWKGKKTQPGPLRALLSRPLATLDSPAIEAWVKSESRTRPTRAALAFRLLRAFVRWCSEQPDFAAVVRADACKPKAIREALPKSKAKDDVLQREQLPAWFKAVRELPPVQAAYLQTVLLTGARREEILGLQWADVDFQWRKLRARDKIDGERSIPLTPYVAQMLSFLPRRQGNPWVFSSALSKSGRLEEPRDPHTRALAAASLPHISIHGLRRSFGSLAEWVEVPLGIVAQIQGHKPSATIEKHYRPRPLDLLRMWHERLETWILTQAGIEPPTRTGETPAPALRVVGGTQA